MVQILFNRQHNLPRARYNRQTNKRSLTPDNMITPLKLVHAIMFRHTILRRFTIRPTVTQVTSIFRRRTPRIHTSLTCADFIRYNCRFIYRHRAAPRVSPTYEEYRRLLRVGCMAMRVLGCLPRSTAPYQLRHISLCFGVFRGMFRSQLRIFRACHCVFRDICHCQWYRRRACLGRRLIALPTPH